MSLSLAEALRLVELQPGQTYREKVNGWTVEVRVLEDDAPTAELAEQVMLQPWVELPFNPVGTVRAQQGTPQLPILQAVKCHVSA